MFQRGGSQRQPSKPAIRERGSARLFRSAPESTFVSQLHTFSQRRSPEKTLPFRKHEGGARALHTKVATLPGLTRRVTKANTAPAATFQPRLTRCLVRKTNCTSPLERRERIACNRIAFEFSLQLFTSTKS